jgi:predicted dehydrogenase
MALDLEVRRTTPYNPSMSITRRNLLQGSAALAAAQRAARPAPSDRITVGCIGTGARGQELMQAVQQHKQAEIVAICDAYKGRIERALDRTGNRAKVHAKYPELLADKSIDAVVIATPDHWHKQIVLDAVRAGKDVYCEKPLTYRTSDGQEIIKAAKSKERIVQVGSQGVSSDIGIKAKEIVQSGKIGKVTMIRAEYNRNTASGAWIYPIPPDATPQTVDWEMFLGPAPKRPFSLERFFRWRCFQDYSGGIATDLFVHLCTTVHYLMNAKVPSRVMAMGELYRWTKDRDVPDTLNAILEYPEGFVASLSSTFNNELSAEGSFQILGTEGSLTIGGGGLMLHPDNSVEDNRWIVESWAKGLEEAYYRDPKVIQTEVEAGKRPRKQAQQVPTDPAEATMLHFGHFFDSIRSRQPYWEDAAAGHHAAACAHMVNKSAREHRQVEWDFSKDEIRG